MVRVGLLIGQQYRLLRNLPPRIYYKVTYLNVEENKRSKNKKIKENFFVQILCSNHDYKVPGVFIFFLLATKKGSTKQQQKFESKRRKIHKYRIGHFAFPLRNGIEIPKEGGEYVKSS